MKRERVVSPGHTGTPARVFVGQALLLAQGGTGEAEFFQTDPDVFVFTTRIHFPFF